MKIARNDRHVWSVNTSEYESIPFEFSFWFCFAFFGRRLFEFVFDALSMRCQLTHRYRPFVDGIVYRKISIHWIASLKSSINHLSYVVWQWEIIWFVEWTLNWWNLWRFAWRDERRWDLVRVDQFQVLKGNSVQFQSGPVQTDSFQSDVFEMTSIRTGPSKYPSRILPHFKTDSSLQGNCLQPNRLPIKKKIHNPNP